MIIFLNTGLLSDKTTNSTISTTGITKILKENENHWINADVTDYSLSSLLGHLDCPKTNQSSASFPHDTQMSQDVCVLNIAYFFLTAFFLL